jgi:hypothetical protein
MGVLARRISLEVIPIILLAIYAGLLGVYILAANFKKPQTTDDPIPTN